MLRNGRGVDANFLPSEKLYLRCKTAWIGENGHVNPAYIHFPDQSVNRQKYSYPVDVLWPDEREQSRAWINWGVASLRVEDLPPEMRTSGNAVYCFTAEHDPLDDNYSHTELRVYKDGERECDSKKINQLVKKEYRTILALRTRLEVRPLV
jgi:hypothetical protein